VKLEFVRDRKSEIQELAASHGARNVRLFGSVARGDSRSQRVALKAMERAGWFTARPTA